MTELTLNIITGTLSPCVIYVCDVYGANCVLLASVPGSINPIPYTFVLPPPYDVIPALMLKIIDGSGCEYTEILYCEGVGNKQFMDSVDFYFMDGGIYRFQFQ